MTAQTDGATIQRNPLLNFMLMCVVWSKAVYLKCVNCAPHLAAGGAKDAEYVATKMIEAIRTLPHPCYVDLIITDGAGDMTKFRGLMVAVFSWLYTMWCVFVAARTRLMPRRASQWRTKKPTGWKGKRGSWKQWNAVTELDPKHHAEEITSKGGVENTRESYLIDEDLYDMIIAVPEAEQPRKVEEKPDEPMDEED